MQLLKIFSLHKNIYEKELKGLKKFNLPHLKFKYFVLAICIFSIPFLYISYGAGKENLFSDQESLYSVIFPYIFVTVMFDSRVVLEGEIRC